jgi:phosphatidylglycerophosphate synthase
MQITGIGLLCSIAGLVLLAMGATTWGALLLNLAYVFDQVDGNVARITKQTSTRGAWFDSLVGFLYSSFTLFALAFGLAREPQPNALLTYLHLPNIFTSSQFILACGALGSAAIVTRKIAVLTATMQASNDSLTIHSKFASRSFVFSLPKVLNSYALITLLFAAMLHLSTAYLWVYSLYQILLFILVFMTTYRHLK